MHPYPAKFPAALAAQNLDDCARPDSIVLDPFCGSGTTLVEAKYRGMHAIGVDSNDLACLISRVKTTPLKKTDFNAVERVLDDIRHERRLKLGGAIRGPANFINCSHWFQQNVILEISALLDAIRRIRSIRARDFLRVVLSSIVVRVSNQESDTRYAAVDKKVPDEFTRNLFIKKTEDNMARMRHFSAFAPKSKISVHCADSRDLSCIRPCSVDCVITSPPYANTYDYYLYHKFRSIWLNLDFRSAQRNEIGSRREFSSLKRGVGKWREDMYKCISEIHRVMKSGGTAVVVIGDSVIAGEKIDNGAMLAETAESLNFKILRIDSSEQAKNSKSFNPMFSRAGKREHVIRVQKT